VELAQRINDEHQTAETKVARDGKLKARHRGDSAFHYANEIVGVHSRRPNSAVGDQEKQRGHRKRYRQQAGQRPAVSKRAANQNADRNRCVDNGHHRGTIKSHSVEPKQVADVIAQDHCRDGNRDRTPAPQATTRKETSCGNASEIWGMRQQTAVVGERNQIAQDECEPFGMAVRQVDNVVAISGAENPKRSGSQKSFSFITGLPLDCHWICGITAGSRRITAGN